ncbi:acyl-CoA synthetase [Streptococcus gallolyticus]|nr:acyl-CoA synthetase [Streptococcus gallolyticus]MBY5042009.1 acyl-CoA synthetase [Streptococcus gallolyticus]
MTELFPYQPMNLYANYKEASQLFPDCEIVFDQPLVAYPELGVETTYRLSHEAIVERAGQLAAKGVKKGDKVIIFKAQAFDTYMLAVSVTYLGAVPVMVSYHFPQEVIEVFAERLENPYILYDDFTSTIVEKAVNISPEYKIAIEALLQETAQNVQMDALEHDEIAYITHTSGTTGIPKLICHSANSMGWRTKFQKTILNYLPERRIVGFHISPVHSRFNIGMSSLMLMGFPLLPLSTAQSDVVERMFLKYQPQAVETHPNHFVQWADLARQKPEVFANINYYHSTFDAINNATMAAFLKASNSDKAIFLQIYGQSECGPMILKPHTLESLKSSNARDMGVGLGDLTKARITDAEGNPVAPGVDGHIQLYSRGRALTYFKEDERFAANVYDEWWDSGDYGSMDENGHLYLKDRQVDLIETIQSNLALEDMLLDKLDFLAEVVLVRDKVGKPQPILAVRDQYEMDMDAWWQAISNLPYLNLPIILPYDQLPRTATMKIQRLTLEKMLKEGSLL